MHEGENVKRLSVHRSVKFIWKIILADITILTIHEQRNLLIKYRIQIKSKQIILYINDVVYIAMIGT